jgi:hypothetical protein
MKNMGLIFISIIYLKAFKITFPISSATQSNLGQEQIVSFWVVLFVETF